MPEKYADPCFVHSAVLWTTQSADWMHSSDKVCQDFYRNPAVAFCLLENGTRIDKPATALEFPFNSIYQI
jgi:hypothetical protein